MEYILLCIFWLIWCFLHSYFVRTETTEWFKRRLGTKFGGYRIAYNLISIITVLPLFYWQKTIPGPLVLPLSPYLLLFKNISVVLSIIIVAGSFFSFDILDFFGIGKRATKYTKAEKGQVIHKNGFYGIVRHPMYLGGIVFFTASMTNAPFAEFSGFMILAVYMIIGTILEDRRLSRELGDVYREYQKEVPMIIPRFPVKKT